MKLSERISTDSEVGLWLRVEVENLEAELATERAAREYAEAQHAHKHAQVESLRAEVEALRGLLRRARPIVAYYSDGTKERMRLGFDIDQALRAALSGGESK